MSGQLFVVEGLDGSGKATQSQLLVQWLVRQGYTAKKRSYPNYQSDSSALVRMYLEGRLCEKSDEINAFAASSFFAVDRFATFIKEDKEFYEKGGIIVLDRFTSSNAIHQCSKLPQSQWNDYLEWLYDFEYNKLELPKPTATFYLNMSLEVSQSLLTKRYEGSACKRDIHEKDLDYLQRSQAAAQYCKEKLGWYEIVCDDGSEPYSIEYISHQLQKTIKEQLKGKDGTV